MKTEASIRRLADCPTGRIYSLQADLPAQFGEWFRQHGRALATIRAHEVRLFDGFGLRREVDGRLVLYEMHDAGCTREVPDCRLNDLGPAWGREAAEMQLRLMLLDKLRQAAGKDYRMGDLARLEPSAFEADPFGWILKPYKPEIKAAGQALLAMLDETIVQLCEQAMQQRASLALYNIIATQRAAWLEIAEEAPGLMPVVAHAIERQWLPFDREVLHRLKTAVLNEGYSTRDWKMLARLPLSHTRWILEAGCLEGCLDNARHWARVNAGVPPLPLFKRSASARFANWGNIAVPPWFDRAALLEYPAREAVNRHKHFVRIAYQDALDWLRSYLEEGGQPDKNQQHAGWAWIARQSQAWHEAAARMKESGHYQWKSLLDAYPDGAYEVVPLTSSGDLAAEGRRMHHCVGAYAEYCHAGRHRIFSIRQAGKALATAELVGGVPAGHWRLNQVRGPCNAAAPAAVMAVAQRLCARYNQAAAAVRTN